MKLVRFEFPVSNFDRQNISVLKVFTSKRGFRIVSYGILNVYSYTADESIRSYFNSMVIDKKLISNAFDIDLLTLNELEEGFYEIIV